MTVKVKDCKGGQLIECTVPVSEEPFAGVQAVQSVTCVQRRGGGVGGVFLTDGAALCFTSQMGPRRLCRGVQDVEQRQRI